MLILMDSGSLEPAAVLALRALAARLRERLGEDVSPVSLLHGSKIPADRIGGVPADTLGPFLRRRHAEGVRDFRILPLFFGPSSALAEYLPAKLAEWAGRLPGLRASVAPHLCADEAGEATVARILADRVAEAAPAGPYSVVMCDHGSPVRDVAALRDRLAARLRVSLGGATPVTPASMERREGAEYDFNGPMLADALLTPPWDSGEVVVAMQFLLPGRHAGEAGDVARLCAEAERLRPALRTRRTALVADHPALLPLLAARV